MQPRHIFKRGLVFESYGITGTANRVTLEARKAELGGVWVPRSEAPPLVVAAPLVTCEGLPPGSVVTVTDGETGEVLATLTDPTFFDLPDPGPYAVEVTPPLPWLPRSLLVIVP